MNGRDQLTFRLCIEFDTKWCRRALAALLLLAAPLELGSETVLLNTAYPSPTGVYNSIITTGGGANPNHSILNMYGGNTILVLGSTGGVGVRKSPAAGVKLDVAGDIMMSGYLIATGALGTTNFGPPNGQAGFYGDSQVLAARIPAGSNAYHFSVGLADGSTNYASFGPNAGPSGVGGGKIFGSLATTGTNAFNLCGAARGYSGFNVGSPCTPDEMPFPAYQPNTSVFSGTSTVVSGGSTYCCKLRYN